MSVSGRTGRTCAGVAAAVLAVAGARPGVSPLEARGPSVDPVAATRQTPAFRAGIDIVSLTVTVTDPAGRYVTDLSSGQFRVFEDAVAQEVTYFNRTNLPIALALLLDTSASMEERMTTAQNAAIGFVRRLQPHDVAELIGFDRDVRVMQGIHGRPGGARAGRPLDDRRPGRRRCTMRFTYP